VAFRVAFISLLCCGAAACAAPQPPAPSTVGAAAAAPPAARAAAAPAPAAEPARVDFRAQILPILGEKCSPCHFEGGKMYARLPFDQEATIRVLGTGLFTRLTDEQDQALVRAFLDQQEPPRPNP
jgi:hypothetical protein